MLEKMETGMFDRIYDIITKSFPENEYRPYNEQKDLLVNPYYNIYTYCDDEGNLIAFIALWLFEGFIFAEHFAVSPQYRNGGIGSRILSELQCRYNEMICLEVELPDNDIAKHRIEFYKRNGFYLNDYSYMQPSISAGREPLPLMIMTTKRKITSEEFNLMKSVIYKNVYKIF